MGSSEYEDTAPLVTQVTDPESTGPQSPMEALRVKRDETAARTEVLIPLPGYEEAGLKAKYRLIDRKEVADINKRVRAQTKDQGEYMFRVILDTIIAACEGFYLAPDGVPDEEAEPLVSEEGEVVTDYMAFASHLKRESFTNHRQAVVYVFGGNDFTAGQHGLLLNRWLSNTGIEIDQEFLDYTG